MKSFYVISDLHLYIQKQPFMFTATKEKIFSALCDEILEKKATLVFAGDIFDITATESPAVGLDEFFLEVLGYPFVWQMHSSLDERFQALRGRFPEFFKNCARLAREGLLSVIPGNHDCCLRDKNTQKIFAAQLGVAVEKIHFTEFVKAEDFVVTAHGHEFDRDNQTSEGCRNPGAVMTSALFQAVIPALRELGASAELCAAIPAVRPEEAIVHGIEDFLGPQRAKSFLLAFVRLLERNGYFRGFNRLLMKALTHRIPLLSAFLQRGITPQRIRAMMPAEKSLLEMGRRGAKALREKYGAKLVVMGHTHELDLNSDYVNLGTWIDHLRGFTANDFQQADTSLPIFHKTIGEPAYLANGHFLEDSKKLSDCPKLWTES